MKPALVLTMLLAVSNLFAQQSKNPITDVLREMLTGRAKNTIAAIDAMPADKFNFKPTPYDVILMGFVTVFTLVSVSLYLVEWVRHMSTIDAR